MGKTQSIFSVFIILLIVPLFCGCIEESTNKELDLLDSVDDTDLIGYWRFDEKSWTKNEIIDSSGNNNHGTVFETTLIQPGRIGRGHVFFDGVDDYIIVKNNKTLQPQEFTIEAWVKKTESNHFEYIISKGASLCDYSSFGLYTDPVGGLTFYASDGVNMVKSSLVNTSLWNGNWHHVVSSYNGSFCRLYIDGKETQSNIDHNLSINYTLSTHNDLIIGAYNGSCFLPFNGYVDEIFIWNRVLNITEIQDHYLIGKKIGSSIDESQMSLAKLKEKIRLELIGLSYSDIVIIKGSNLSIQEEMLMYFAQQQITDIDKIESFYDTEISNISNLSSSYKKFIFLGGNKTNDIVQSFETSKSLKIEEQYHSSPFIISFGNSSNLKKEIIIFSTTIGESTLQNKGPDRSPLSRIIDKRITPIVATVASISIIQIANLFGSTISEFFFDFTSEKLGERKKKKHQFKKDKKTNVLVTYLKEIGSIIVAIFIFSVSLSWTWSTDFTHFFSLLIINLFVVSIFYLIREGLRIYYSRKYNLNTEHVFWPLGSFLTFISTLLGNTFSLTSYIALENEEKEKRYSKMYFAIFLILFVLTLFFFLINSIFGSQIIQMFYVFTIMALFIDMTPLEPLDGYEVKKHDLKRWIILYIPVFILYLLIMFSTIL